MRARPHHAAAVRCGGRPHPDARGGGADVGAAALDHPAALGRERHRAGHADRRRRPAGRRPARTRLRPVPGGRADRVRPVPARREDARLQRHGADLSASATPSDEAAAAHAACEAAITAAIAAAAPASWGASCTSWSATCSAISASRRRSTRPPRCPNASEWTFSRGLGHGVGFHVHEPPGAGTQGFSELEEGDSLTIEPRPLPPGVGGCRIEDHVILTATVPRTWTRWTRAGRPSRAGRPGRPRSGGTPRREAVLGGHQADPHVADAGRPEPSSASPTRPRPRQARAPTRSPQAGRPHIGHHEHAGLGLVRPMAGTSASASMAARRARVLLGGPHPSSRLRAGQRCRRRVPRWTKGGEPNSIDCSSASTARRAHADRPSPAVPEAGHGMRFGQRPDDGDAVLAARIASALACSPGRRPGRHRPRRDQPQVVCRAQLAGLAAGRQTAHAGRTAAACSGSARASGR